MNFHLTAFVYFIATISANVSATSEKLHPRVERNTSNLDQTYPYHLTYKSEDKLDMVISLLNFPPSNSSVYVTYETDDRENRTTTDVYPSDVPVQKLLKGVIKVLVHVEAKTQAGLCQQKILEATLEDKINTTGFALIDSCVAERCYVTANLTEGSCKDNEIPFTIRSANRCYGKSCTTANETELDEETQRRILELMMNVTKNPNLWNTLNPREVYPLEDINTHFDIPQITFQEEVTVKTDFIDMDDLRNKIRNIRGPNLGSSCSPAKALILLLITISFIHILYKL